MNPSTEKDLSHSTSKRLFAIFRMALITAFPLSSLFAESTRHELSPEQSITLPETWKLLDRPKEPSMPEGKQTRISHESVKLILTATSVDPARRLFLSILRSPASRLPAGQLRKDEELERLLFLVLSQGYRPTYSGVQQTESASAAPSTSVEVYAQNTAGEYRVFSCTISDSPSSTLRLFSSRPMDDHQAAGEISAISRSLQNQSRGDAGTFSESQHRPEFVGEDRPFMTSEISELVQKHHSSLILVEGKKGVGSGFLCSMDGRIHALTNTHVLAGNPGFKITSLSNTTIEVTTPALAVGRDLARFEAAAVENGFEAMTDLEQNVKIGDVVVVPGNAEGAKVVRPDIGRVVAIGPDRIEIDAPFVKGCSGSPIIHLDSGKVIGIATYLTERTTPSEEGRSGRRSSRTVTRRFGYRIDGIKSWEPVNWQRFFAQAAQLQGIENVSGDFIKLVTSANAGEAFHSATFSSQEVRRPVELYVNSVNRGGRNMSLADRKKLVRSLVSDLRHATRSDILKFDAQNAYDYFRTEVEDHSRYRNQLYESLTRSLESQMN